MSFPEFIHRLKKAISPSPKLPDISQQDFSKQARFANLDVEPNTQVLPNKTVEQYISLAERTIGGVYDIFNVNDLHISGYPNWHRDYLNNKSAPLVATSKLNYHDRDVVGDVKYIWELNRHQHIVPVSIAYFFSERDKYKNFVLGTIDNWLDENPYGIGVNWKSSLELALRIISWYFSLSFVCARSAIPKEILDKILESVYTHAFHIVHNPSLYSSANNHLIGEMTGVVCAATLLPDVEDLRLWRAEALDILLNECARQVYPDGVGTEQSPFYQAYTVDYYLLNIFFLKQSGQTIPDEFLDLVFRSAQFFKSIMNINREIPHIGDDDGGISVRLHAGEDFNNYASIINSANVLLGNRETSFDENVIDEKTYWLLSKRGEENGRQKEENKDTSLENKRQFPDGGYFLIGDNFGKEDEVLVIFDCGDLGQGKLCAHGHSDALSFVLSYKGNRFLIDPGTYSYYKDDKTRDYFRSTSAHNTVRISGKDQSIMNGPFLWGTKANAALKQYRCHAEVDQVAGEHYGYCRLKSPLTHARELRYFKEKRTLLIDDCLKTSGAHTVEMFFHFHKSCLVEMKNNECKAILGEASIRMRLDERLSWELVKGNDDPMCGWQSETFGSLEPCYTLRGKAEIQKQTTLVTTIELL